MAGFSNARRVLLAAVLLVFLVVNVQGRALPDKRIDSRLLLRQLGDDGAEPSSDERASTMDVDPTKVAPGGPNPHHHFTPPSALRYGAEPSSDEWASTMDADPTKVAPGGPNPHHHFIPPPALR
ncbi:hypothetical protein BT93_K1890 [Corymbia citriodora subsp. variegata]|nr:hypothetical protein BT93_K1890 [Corymbia citriodora subsp. variegata]